MQTLMKGAAIATLSWMIGSAALAQDTFETWIKTAELGANQPVEENWDEITRKACESEQPAMLSTYRMELGDRYIPVKNVFVPLYFKGRRWGNFELAYRDE